MSFDATQLIAHRGWQQSFPENSLLSVTHALKKGALHIEVDVQLSADLSWYLCHDSSLQRLAGVDKVIHSLSNHAINRLSFHEPKRLQEEFKPCRPITLNECIAFIKQHNANTAQTTQLYIEVKQESIDAFGLSTVIESLQQTLGDINHSECWVISFNYSLLNALYQQGQQQLIPVISQWLDWQQLHFAPDMVFSHIRLLPDCIDPTLLKVACYEVSTQQEATALFKRGVSLCESFDFVGLLDNNNPN